MDIWIDYWHGTNSVSATLSAITNPYLPEIMVPVVVYDRSLSILNWPECFWLISPISRIILTLLPEVVALES